VVTLQRIAEVRGVLFAIAHATKAPGFRLERFAAAIYDKQMDTLLKAVRTPTTNDKVVQTTFKNDKIALRNGIITQAIINYNQ
jgi:hypothetical protein